MIGKYPKENEGWTEEDLLFMICDWFYHRGGRSKMKNSRNIKEMEGVTFTKGDFLDYAGKDKEELFDGLVSEGMEHGIMEVKKETKKNRIYELKIDV